MNVTVTNKLLEVYKTLISAKTLCFMTFFLIPSLLPIQKGGYVVYMYAKAKTQISLAVIAKLTSAFVFAIHAGVKKNRFIENVT